MKRVVITGIGILSPLGCGVRESWTNLIEGRCGITKLQGEAFTKLPCQVAGLLFNKDKRFDLQEHFSKSDLRTMAPASAYALIAAKEALDDANWHPDDENSKERTGVAVGMGMVDLQDICETNDALKKSYNRVSFKLIITKYIGLFSLFSYRLVRILFHVFYLIWQLDILVSSMSLEVLIILYRRLVLQVLTL